MSARVSIPPAASALLVGLAVMLSGCDVDSGGAPGGPEVSRDAVPEVENPTGPERYRDLVDEIFVSLSAYWNRQLPGLDGEPGTPKRLISYRRAAENARCGGRPAIARNAQFCPSNTSILWDADWVHGTLYRRVGDAAVAFLLAHEYGHFVQDRLRIQNDFWFTIEGELNADCLAGDWLANVDSRERRLSRADFDALFVGVLEVADPRGTPWQDPSAHGRAAERRRALTTGARRGARACMNVYGPGFTR